MIAWILITLLIISIGIIVWGSANIQANFFLKAIHQGIATTRQIALTFDDGPHPVYTPQVLALLKQHSIQATFFCIGKHVAQYPEIVKQIHMQGHVVGNHSFTHAATIDFQSRAKWGEELRKTDAAIAHVIGSKPHFFRPPYGVSTPHLAAAVNASGHAVIGWRVRPYDTSTTRQPERIIRAILKKVKPGHIILLHDTHARIAPVLEQLLPQLKKRGLSMVTVEKLIQQHAYLEI
jgi:peptidoglycan-N-acetylglucosamine deacetylase